MNLINKVSVIGSGVMGAQIAAHIANAGVPVMLLDIVPEGASRRSIIAEEALQKMLKSEPAAFMHKRNAALVTPGNIEDDLEQAAQADWIIEAVVECADIKQQLYHQLQELRKPGSIVSSNTSGIPLALLMHEMPPEFAADFMITHFFNPPRYMRLLELLGGSHTRPDALALIHHFCDHQLGKGVVECKDTPGFIANRIGMFWIQCALHEAINRGIKIEEADAVMFRAMNVPKTGVFALLDLIGLDLMPHLSASMEQTLPAGDLLRDYLAVPPQVSDMITAGYTGRKGKGGFYQLHTNGDGKRIKQARKLRDGSYYDAGKPRPECLNAMKDDGLRGVLSQPDDLALYFREVLLRTLHYAASLIPNIADDAVAADSAMRLGYNWRYGPFELIDRIGAAWFAEQLPSYQLTPPDYLQKALQQGFYRVCQAKRQSIQLSGRYEDVRHAPGILTLSQIKDAGKPLAQNASAALWDVGDGVLCVEFHSKMNAIDPDILKMLNTALEYVHAGEQALVLHNEGDNFSVGANIGLLLFIINIAAWQDVEDILQSAQQTYRAMKYAPFPVVGAPSGMALGGGCEVLLHCDAIQAHAETYIGLVEAGVGVIPGWGGCTEMLLRWIDNPGCPGGPMPPVRKVFEMLSMAQVAKSAVEAQEMGFLRPSDGISMNRERVLHDAKVKALQLTRHYTPPKPRQLALPGPSAKAAMDIAIHDFRKAGKATPHDVLVAGTLARVLSGGDNDVSEPCSEEDILKLEREAFMALIQTPGTIARIEHMLETGKPLRN